MLFGRTGGPLFFCFVFAVRRRKVNVGGGGGEGKRPAEMNDASTPVVRTHATIFLEQSALCSTLSFLSLTFCFIIIVIIFYTLV